MQKMSFLEKCRAFIQAVLSQAMKYFWSIFACIAKISDVFADNLKIDALYKNVKAYSNALELLTHGFFTVSWYLNIYIKIQAKLLIIYAALYCAVFSFHKDLAA